MVASNQLSTLPVIFGTLFGNLVIKKLKVYQQELLLFFRSAAFNNSVVPQDGVMAETGDEGGDFIFILKEN